MSSKVSEKASRSAQPAACAGHYQYPHLGICRSLRKGGLNTLQLSLAQRIVLVRIVENQGTDVAGSFVKDGLRHQCLQNVLLKVWHRHPCAATVLYSTRRGFHTLKNHEGETVNDKSL